MRQADNLITGIKASPRTRLESWDETEPDAGLWRVWLSLEYRSWMSWFLGIAVCIIRGSSPRGSWPKVDSLTVLVPITILVLPGIR